MIWPLSDRIARARARAAEREADRAELFAQTVQAAARALATRGDCRVVEPVVRREADARPLRIGLFGNLANQAYITARALRRLGHDVEVVVQPNNIDAYPMSRPFWEEREGEIGALDEADALEGDWCAPKFVRVVPYDMDRQIAFQNRLSAVAEVIALYREATGVTLARDVALVLAQWMGHWDYIKAMADYDVVHLSMWPIALGAFCPRPYVACPLGGELYINAFQEDVQGLMMRAGFRGAAHLSIAETDYPRYLDRLETWAPRSFLPLVVDTDVYAPEPDEAALREEWRARVGGERFVLGVCRQSWRWKGSDLLIRGFAAFHAREGGAWRLLLQSWGDDLERSRALVTELGLDAVTTWLPMCAKPTLRKRQRAADVVADQFVMEGYGASVLESLAAGKPVVMAPVPQAARGHFRAGPPPLVGARCVEEIADALSMLADDRRRAEIAQASRQWVEREHGYKAQEALYVAMFEQAAGRKPAPDAAETLSALRRDFAAAREETRARWRRALPFGEAVSDRWEKARFLGFGEGASIYDSAIVIGDVTVGAKSWIGPNVMLDGSGGLSVGAGCSVSAGCQIYSHDTVAWAASGGRAAYRHASTRIGDAVYLGPNCVVAAGSEIGAGAIVGAASFVNGAIPAGAFAVGAPARVIGRVEIAADGSAAIIRTDKPLHAGTPS